MTDTSRHRRITAGILGMLLIFVMLFSIVLIAAEADHDCQGEDCMICACLSQCENNIRQLSIGLSDRAAIILPLIFLLVSILPASKDSIKLTPVSGKVRMNN